jgi:hypothetical protein
VNWLAGVDQAVEIAYDFGVEQDHSPPAENPARHERRYAIPPWPVTCQFLPGLSPVRRHDIHARFDGGALSSDGGVLLLREIERGQNFSGMLASCLHDARDPGRTIHDHTTMIRERMFAIACG